MLHLALFALAAGAAVSLSRAVNGRLALSTSAMASSFWNHAVGFAALSAWALAFGGLAPAGWPDPPAWAWAGGTLGVIFVASGSYLVARLGGALTAILVIAGQMISGVALDAALGTGAPTPARVAGVALILAGMALLQARRR